jgi:hypothetical protein
VPHPSRFLRRVGYRGARLKTSHLDSCFDARDVWVGSNRHPARACDEAASEPLQKEPKSGFLGCDISDITAHLITYVAVVANITYGYRRPLHVLRDNSNKVFSLEARVEMRSFKSSATVSHPSQKARRMGHPVIPWAGQNFQFEVSSHLPDAGGAPSVTVSYFDGRCWYSRRRSDASERKAGPRCRYGRRHPRFCLPMCRCTPPLRGQFRIRSAYA